MFVKDDASSPRIMRRLTTLYSSETLEGHTDELGVIERDGKDEFDTNKPHVVKTLLYAALLSLLVSRELLDLIIEQADDEIVFPPER